MAKKSAKSKGYRKTVAKKAYLSKKEITVTAIIIGVVFLALALFIGLYDDGSLKVKDGAVNVEGENNLIVNAGTGYEPRYFKLGQLSEIDGYALSATPMDDIVDTYTYTPDGESPIDSITVRTYSLDADTYASASEENYTTDPSMSSDGLHTTEDDGHAVSYLTFRVTPSNNTDPDALVSEAVDELLEEAKAAGADEETLQVLQEQAEAESEPTLVQALHGYVNVGENRMIYILVRNDVETVEEYVDDALLVEALNQTLAALSYETK